MDFCSEYNSRKTLFVLFTLAAITSIFSAFIPSLQTCHWKFPAPTKSFASFSAWTRSCFRATTKTLSTRMASTAKIAWCFGIPSQQLKPQKISNSSRVFWWPPQKHHWPSSGETMSSTFGHVLTTLAPAPALARAGQELLFGAALKRLSRGSRPGPFWQGLRIFGRSLTKNQRHLWTFLLGTLVMFF